MIRLAQTKRFRARWTDEIHREWIEALLRNSPHLERAQLNGTRELIDRAVPDCLVTGYQGLTKQLSLPDPKDRHVLAAAIRAGAQAIVTVNLKDFPSTALDRYEIFARHPDDFVLDLADLEPAVVTTVVKQQRAALKNPPCSPEELIATLRRQGLTGVAAFLESEIELIWVTSGMRGEIQFPRAVLGSLFVAREDFSLNKKSCDPPMIVIE